MGSCRLLVDTAVGFVGTLSDATDNTGFGVVGLHLPDAPVFLGDFYAQWVFLDPGANALGASTTNGLRVMVR